MKYLILFFIYSFFGVGVEVFFTSIKDYIKTRDIAFRGRSYLWMFPIYGVMGIIIGPLYNAIIKAPFILRGFIYMAVIFIGEFIYGYLLKLIIKKVPWEYKSKWAIMGIARMDYLPFWLVLGYIMELLYRGFISVTIY
ncbi:MAG: putative ABC transporter permease [Actinobacteria bacterium]|nr:putative ABC transporter permease [Actinomycetota bacterium]